MRLFPNNFYEKVTRTGFGKHLFHDWRFLDDEGTQPNPSFILNQSIYQVLCSHWRARILVVESLANMRLGRSQIMAFMR